MRWWSKKSTTATLCLCVSDRLQSVRNAAARPIFSARRSEHISPLLRELAVRSGQNPDSGCVLPSVADSLHRTADVVCRRHLRSANTASLTVPSTHHSTLSDRAFPVGAVTHHWTQYWDEWQFAVISPCNQPPMPTQPHSAGYEMSIGQRAVTVLNYWESNWRSYVAVAMHRRLCDLSTHELNGFKNKDKHLHDALYTPFTIFSSWTTSNTYNDNATWSFLSRRTRITT